jgi:hypothetical protein
MIDQNKGEISIDVLCKLFRDEFEISEFSLYSVCVLESRTYLSHGSEECGAFVLVCCCFRNLLYRALPRVLGPVCQFQLGPLTAGASHVVCAHWIPSLLSVLPSYCM